MSDFSEGVPKSTKPALVPSARGYLQSPDDGSDPWWWDGDTGNSSGISDGTTLDVTDAMINDPGYADGLELYVLGAGADTWTITVEFQERDPVSFSYSGDVSGVEETWSTAGIITGYTFTTSPSGEFVGPQELWPHLTNAHIHQNK